jgi:murein DD-endopeptidase MepM/ murein hydrolase activator NlpD
MTDSGILKKYLGRKLTVMLIPHGGSSPFHINLSLALLLFGVVSWSALTVWSGVIISRHIDYWRVKADEQVLKVRVWYFSQEIRRSQESLNRVREAEVALQNLLNMKTRNAIIESDKGIGGPSLTDQKLLTATMTHPGTMDVDLASAQLESARAETRRILENFQEISRYIQSQRDLFHSTPRNWPTLGRLTSRFGLRRDPTDEDGEEFHKGIDIASAKGTPVTATADGIVRIASYQGGYGRLVVIDHGHGFRTCYAHNSRILVKPGDIVKRGQVIALMGTSGHSTGYHLHYEVWKNGQVVNPLRFVQTN